MSATCRVCLREDGRHADDCPDYEGCTAFRGDECCTCKWCGRLGGNFRQCPKECDYLDQLATLSESRP